MKVLVLLFSLTFCFHLAQGQVFESKTPTGNISRVILNDGYFIETVYSQNPAKFIRTRGGWAKEQNGSYQIALEFDSDYENSQEESISLDLDGYELISSDKESLEGNWLFASRVQNGEMSNRRGESSSRKTLKVLKDGYFQWIAYDTATFKFFGSGGGAYTAQNGKYTETISYFSRDNSRVGAVLSFDFELTNGDWHHKGLSSKGEPIHEVWAKREAR